MVIRLTTLEAFIVPTGSMQPTINPGDMVLANKLIYRFRNPDRCEVIVFHPPENISKEPYIKRLIGLPGDTVEIKDGDVFVNGEKIVIEDIPRASSNYGPIKIPKDSLFVLGDNRNGSFDSRSWGFANLRDVIGKGFVIYPEKKIKGDYILVFILVKSYFFSFSFIIKSEHPATQHFPIPLATTAA